MGRRKHIQKYHYYTFTPEYDIYDFLELIYIEDTSDAGIVTAIREYYANGEYIPDATKSGWGLISTYNALLNNGELRECDLDGFSI